MAALNGANSGSSVVCGSAVKDPALEDPAVDRSALAGVVSVRAAGSSTGWFSRSNQVGATGPDPARAVGADGCSGLAHARGGRTGAAPGCGAFGGEALGGDAWGCSLGDQGGLTCSPD